MTKKILRNLLILTMLSILLAACGDDNETENDESGDTYEFRVGGMSAEDNPATVLLREYADAVEEESDGRITFDIYPANQLGDYTTMYDEVVNGTIDMGLFSLPSDPDPRNAVANIPHLVNNYEEAAEQFSKDGFVYNKMKELMKEQNTYMLGVRPIGFGGIGTSKEIQNPAEVGKDKEIMVRIPQNQVTKEYASAMGFNVTSIAFDEIFSAIETGAADGLIGAQPAANYLDFRDVLKYYYQYNNSFEAMPLMISQDLWDELSEEDQQILQRMGDEFTETAMQRAEEDDEMYRNKMEDEGIEVIEFSDEELQEFADFVRKEVWPVAEGTLGKELMEEVLEEVE